MYTIKSKQCSKSLLNKCNVVILRNLVLILYKELYLLDPYT